MRRRIFLYPGAGPGGRNYLRQVGTLRGIQEFGIELSEDLKLSFYCDDADDKGRRDDLYFEGTVHCDPEQKEWYVLIDESSYRPASSEISED